MAEVLKGKWYPAPPPALPDESDVDYTNRMLGVQGKESPYDHARNRQCAIGYHRECSDRHAGSGLDYSGDCQCPHHLDVFTPLPDSELFDAVGILIDLYDLPRATAWRVLDLVDRTCTGVALTSVAHVARLLSREYDSEVTEGFAIDVAHLLANKGPVGAARAFWKGVYDRRAEPESTLADVVRDTMTKMMAELLTDDLDRAAESLVFPPADTARGIEVMTKWASDFFDQSPPTVEVFHDGRSVYSFQVPRDFLGLPDAVAQTPPPAMWKLSGGQVTPLYPKPLSSLLGMPVKVDASLPPGSWKFTRSEDDTEGQISQWPRIKVPGVEPLSEALARQREQAQSKVRDWGWPAPDSERHPLEFHQWLMKQKWFTNGIAIVDQMRMYCAPSMLKGLSWRVPMRLFPRVGSGQTAMLFDVPVLVDDSLPVDGTPYLAFDLKEK